MLQEDEFKELREKERVASIIILNEMYCQMVELVGFDTHYQTMEIEDNIRACALIHGTVSSVTLSNNYDAGDCTEFDNIKHSLF